MNAPTTRKLAMAAALAVVGTLAAFGLLRDGGAERAHAGSTVVSVWASQPWTDSFIDLLPGDVVQISASGRIWIAGSDPGKNPDGTTNPGDTPGTSCGYGFVTENAACWSLIGRVGAGTAFSVGYGTTFTASEAGRLYLGVNDDVFGDNGGSWSATVTVNRIAPSITFLAPNTGSTAGGTPVTITGAGFTGASSVIFGAVPSPQFNVISDAEITAITPAHVAGTVDVQVTTPAGTNPSTSLDQFTYLATPQQLTQATRISAGGDHSLALDASGQLYTWGVDQSGVLPNGSPPRPLPYPFPVAIESVDAGGYYSLALASDHSVWSWGYGAYGQLGTGGQGSGGPAQVLTGPAVAISAGSSHSFAVIAGGTVWAWGDNQNGQLGLGWADPSYPGGVVSSPTLIRAFDGVTAVAAAKGGNHALALKSDGSVWAWGNNSARQLGDGTTTSSFSPKPVPGLPFISAIAAAGSSSYGLDSNGGVWAWGSWNGSTPHPVGGLPGAVIQITAGADGRGGDFVHALTSTGDVYGWGSNYQGMIGNGTYDWQALPLHIQLPAPAVQISDGGLGLALLQDGRIFSWGPGNLGNDTPNGSASPVQVVYGPGNTLYCSQNTAYSARYPYPVTCGADLDAGSSAVIWSATSFSGPIQSGLGQQFVPTLPPDPIPATWLGSIRGDWQDPQGVSRTRTIDLTVSGPALCSSGPSPECQFTGGAQFVGWTAVGFAPVASSNQVQNFSRTSNDAASLTLTFLDWNGGSHSEVFNYPALATIVSIAPPGGPGEGGTTVTITGSGFTGATGVVFGGVAATSFTVNSDTQITATSPAHAAYAAGGVDVQVTTAGGMSPMTTADRFTYGAIAPPQLAAVTSVSPDRGPVAGGTTVTVAGTGFTWATSVTFGSTAAPSFHVDSDTQITATTPATSSPGFVSVVVAPANGTAAGSYTYLAQTPATYFVNTTADDFNDPNCSPDRCSLRQAINASNNHPNVDSSPNHVAFNIPSPGPFQIALNPHFSWGGNALGWVNVPLVIDGLTQPGAQCNATTRNILIEVVPGAVQQNVGGLGLSLGLGDGSTIRGLAFGGFGGPGLNIHGNNNVVECSNFGTDATGMIARPNGASVNPGVAAGIAITGGANNVIGGSTTDKRNILSGNNNSFGPGLLIAGAGATGNRVIGNFIGPDASGLAWPSGSSHNAQGVRIQGASLNVVGGALPGERNVISGNSQAGVLILPGSPTEIPTGNSVLDNLIGVAVDGSSPLPNLRGVRLFGGHGNFITGNTIAHNSPFDGVTVDAGVTGNTISQNSIFDNGTQGISVATWWAPTFNENSPTWVVLSAAAPAGTRVTFELFDNDACDPSGSGEGQRYLSAPPLVAVAGTDGNARLNITPDPAYEGRLITATATREDGTTSAFSTCVRQGLGITSVSSPLAGTQDATVTITGTGYLPGAWVTLGLSTPPGFLNLVTAVDSPTQLRVVIPAAQLATAGWRNVVVHDPAGFASSPVKWFTVNNPAPHIDSVSPSSAVAGSSDLAVSVFGMGFVSGSQIRVNGTGLATTFVSGTSLTATIPGSALAVPATVQITVLNSAPGGGTSNVVPLYVTQNSAVVTSTTAVTNPTPAPATATAGGSGAGTTGSVTAATDSGTGTVAVANYSANPGATPSFSTTGSYFDVYVAPLSTFRSVTITYCDPNGGNVAYWWNGATWAPASNQSYSAASGCITITVDATTTPSLADLQGTAFALGSDTTPPTISTSATKADHSSYVPGTWSNQTVTVHFTCSDSGSGVGSCPADIAYATDGTYTANGMATDRVGNSASTSFGPIQIDKTPPVVAILSPADLSVNSVGLVVTFLATDVPSEIASIVALLNDGTTGSATSVTSGAVVNEAGVYSLTVVATDLAGNATTATRMFVVYDPSAGYVTGGGWINSPAGAYVPNPSLSGRATFGFVSQYKKGANVPTGNTQFQFHAAGLDFKSTSYDWLVVAGAKAQYKGTGTINGKGDYAFFLTVIDGEVNGGGGADKFRIRIWDRGSGGLVYDNQMSEPDDADPTTVLGGGSVVIHK